MSASKCGDGDGRFAVGVEWTTVVESKRMALGHFVCLVSRRDLTNAQLVGCGVV